MIAQIRWIQPAVLPPEKWLAFSRANAEQVPAVEGVYVLADEHKVPVVIKGTADLQAALLEHLDEFLVVGTGVVQLRAGNGHHLAPQERAMEVGVGERHAVGGDEEIGVAEEGSRWR